MPRTREVKFKESFDIFMNQCKEGPSSFENKFNYTLVNNTRNKTRNIHKYTLTIFDSFNDVNTGENHVSILPSNIEFKNKMDKYFEPYQHVFQHNERRYSNKKLSYIKILLNENEQNDIVSIISFNIIYHSNFLPFPVKLTTLQEFQMEVHILNEMLINKEELITSKNKRLDDLKRKIKKFQGNLSKISLENYTLKNEQVTCPVCWENISTEKLETPLCLHLICKDCYSNIHKCPLCREKYIK